MKRDETKIKIEEVEMELADLYSMSEEAACFRYNTDTKQEAIDIVNEELTGLYNQMKEIEEAEAEDMRGWADPAFRNVAEFYRMRI